MPFCFNRSRAKDCVALWLWSRAMVRARRSVIPTAPLEFLFQKAEIAAVPYAAHDQPLHFQRIFRRYGADKGDILRDQAPKHGVESPASPKLNREARQLRQTRLDLRVRAAQGRPREPVRHDVGLPVKGPNPSPGLLAQPIKQIRDRRGVPRNAAIRHGFGRRIL